MGDKGTKKPHTLEKVEVYTESITCDAWDCPSCGSVNASIYDLEQAQVVVCEGCGFRVEAIVRHRGDE